MIRSLTASAVLLALPTFALQAAPAMSAGEYVAKLGDCAACHTSEASKPLAGGKGFPTPVGTVYATNITPDKTHGIGNYSLPEFIKVMREGITRSGDPLYPAMPYTAYAKMSDEDLTALYHYLMQDVQPQATANKASDIPWPFNMRWPLRGWNWLYHDDGRFTPVAGKSEEWNRGAYLVQGAGHCGSCHTPRGIGMQEKALTEADPLYLSGATLDGWYAPDIRGSRYDKQALIDLLKTGRSQHQAVSGPMAEVITHSSQYFSDADLASIATYLTGLDDEAPAARATGPTPVPAARLTTPCTAPPATATTGAATTTSSPPWSATRPCWPRIRPVCSTCCCTAPRPPSPRAISATTCRATAGPSTISRSPSWSTPCAPPGAMKGWPSSRRRSRPSAPCTNNSRRP